MSKVIGAAHEAASSVITYLFEQPRDLSICVDDVLHPRP